MPPKKAAKSSAGVKNCKKCPDIALEPVHNDWNVNIQILVENQISDGEYLKALETTVRIPLRKKFSILSYEEMLQKVQVYGDPKTRKLQKPLPFSEICEEIFQCQEKNEEVPYLKWAKLIKLGILTIKSETSSHPPTSAVTKDKKEKPDKKDKDKGGKGKKGAEPKAAKLQEKDWSTLKKRSDNDVLLEYIDDEPTDGPEHYILITGFHHAQILPLLEKINVFPNGIIRIQSESYEELAALTELSSKPTIMLMQEEKLSEDDITLREKKKEMEARNLDLFWRLLPHVFNFVKKNSKLNDVATHHFVVPSDILPSDWHNHHKMRVFGEKLFELVAFLIYDTVENMRQYKTFLENLKLVLVPDHAQSPPPKRNLSASEPEGRPDADLQLAPPSATKKKETVTDDTADTAKPLDMRYYKDLMDTIPMESVSVPLMLHCMMEQVVATEDGKIPPSERYNTPRDDQMSNQLADHITAALEQISFTPEEEKALADDFPKMKERLTQENREKNKEEKSEGPVIIRYHDEVVARTHHLMSLPDITPVQVEEDMLSNTISAKLVESCPPAEGANERSARLHELIRHQTGEKGVGGLLTSSLMDRGFRQFVFESMPLAHLDKQGNITQVGERDSKDNFWDDPYDLINCEADNMFKRQSQVDEGMIDDLIGSNPCTTLSRQDAQHLRNRLMDKSAKKVPSQGGEAEGMIGEATILYQAISTHNQLSPRRYLDEFVYTEHMGNKVLLQVLEEVRHMYPCMDTYHHKRDNSLLVVFHHPISNQLDAKTKWFRSLYSDVGFRNYQAHVAAGIEDWTMEQDAVYEKVRAAEEQRKEMEKQRLAESRPVTPPQDSKKGKKSGKEKGSKKSSKESAKKAVEESKEEEPGNPFLVPGSLKYENEMKMKDMLNIPVAGSKKERRKSNNSRKSADKKGGDKRAVSANKKGKGSAKSSRNPSPAGSRKSSGSGRKKGRGRSSRGSSVCSPPTTDAEVAPASPPPPQEKQYPFSGYNVGNDLIQISGEETFVYPSDGGVVSMQRFQYENGRNYIRVKVLKDGHVITCHVIEPKNHKEDGHLERLLAPPKKIEICDDVANGSDHEPSFTDRRRSSFADSAGSDAPNKSLEADCHAEFGSTCAVFCDRMAVSFSLHGEDGQCCYTSKLKTKIARLLENVMEAPPAAKEPPPAPVGGKSSPTGKKNSGKKSPRNQSPKSKASPRAKSPKNTKKEEEHGVERKSSVASEHQQQKKQQQHRSQHTKSQFPQLYVSCPDGLALCYDNFGPKQQQRDDGGSDAPPMGSPNPFVRQHYPIKTRARTASTCNKPISPGMKEKSRLIMNDGTVVKLMLDGSIKILCLNGTVHTNRAVTATAALHAAGQTAGGDVISTPRSNCAAHEHAAATTPEPTPTTPGGRKLSTPGGRERKGSMKSGGGERRNSAQNSIDGPQKADTEIDLSTCWQTTRITGEVFLVKDNGCTFPQHNAKRICYTAQDPVTKEILLSLEDRVMRVVRPDGGIVCDHEDGTRISRFLAQNNDGRMVWYVRVECVGFATVTFDQTTKESFTVFGSGSNLSVTQGGNYKLNHWTGGDLTLTADGVAIYNPAVDDDEKIVKQPCQQLEDDFIDSTDRMDEFSYILRHNAPICFEMIDCNGNLFQVKNNGEVNTYNPINGNDEEEDGGGAAHQSRMATTDPKEEYLNKYTNHAPRLFIIHKDGSGSELLRHRDLKRYIRSAEDDPLTAVIRETMIGDSGAVGLTVMRPHPNEIGDVWFMEPEENDIVPPNIRTRDLMQYDFRKPMNFDCVAEFGKKTGKGLTITPRAPSSGGCGPMAPLCPDALETRQLIRYPEISKDTRELLRTKFMEFVGDLGLQEIRRQSLQVQDPRVEDEVMRANDLLTLVLEYDDGLKECHVTPVQMPDADIHSRTPKNADQQATVLEEHIKPSCVRPEGEDEAKARKAEYEANLKIKSPPTVRKAAPTLSKEVWNVIRSQIMEEKHDRDALTGKTVPPYFLSEEGRAWLVSQSRTLNEAAAAISHDKCGKPGRKTSMSVALAEKDHQVYVGKRPIDKINVSDKGVNEINQFRSSVEHESSQHRREAWTSPVLGNDHSRPENPTPNLANPDLDRPLSNSELAACMDPRYKSFLQQIEDSCSTIEHHHRISIDGSSRHARHRLDSYQEAHTNDSNDSVSESYRDMSLGSSIRQILHKLDHEANSTDTRSQDTSLQDFKEFNVMNWPNMQSSPISNRDQDPNEPVDNEMPRIHGRTPQNLPIDSTSHILNDFYQGSSRKPYGRTEPPATNNAAYYCQQVAWNENEETRGMATGGKKDAMMAASLLSYNPNAQLNTKFLQVEEPVRRQVNNSSIAGPLNKGNVKVLRRGFELVPREINFGILKEGESYRFTVKLRNIGIDSCRYKIKQPPPSTGISVQFSPRMVAAGLEVPLTIDIFAIAAGLDSNEGMGRIGHRLEITAETDIFHLPISATVLTAHEYEHVYGNQERQLQIAPGVIHLRNRGPSRPSRGSGDMI